MISTQENNCISDFSTHIVAVVRSLSHVQLFATPWTAVFQASPSFTISQSLLKLMSSVLVMPSNHLILSCLITLKFCCTFNSGIATNPFYDSRLHISSKGLYKSYEPPPTPCYPSSMPWPRFPRKSTCKQEVAYEAMLGLKNTIYMSSHLQQNIIFNVTTLFLSSLALAFCLAWW